MNSRCGWCNAFLLRKLFLPLVGSTANFCKGFWSSSIYVIISSLPVFMSASMLFYWRCCHRTACVHTYPVPQERLISAQREKGFAPGMGSCPSSGVRQVPDPGLVSHFTRWTALPARTFVFQPSLGEGVCSTKYIFFFFPPIQEVAKLLAVTSAHVYALSSNWGRSRMIIPLMLPLPWHKPWSWLRSTGVFYAQRESVLLAQTELCSARQGCWPHGVTVSSWFVEGTHLSSLLYALKWRELLAFWWGWYCPFLRQTGSNGWGAN